MDSNKRKMHMKNNKQHKTRKHQDQTRRLVKNNLKIMKNTMNEWDFRKMQEKFLKACNWHQTLKLTQDSNKNTKYFFGFYDFMIFCIFIDFFFENIFEKKRKRKEKFWKRFLKNFWKENYLIWATRWTVSCPYSNNPRQRRQKLGGRNCDHIHCNWILEIFLKIFWKENKKKIT